MIVDDDPSILITIREIFESEGYEVYTVGSGKDCLDELEQGFKGFILMDIMMPFMDGWDTIREIVKNGYHRDNIIAMLTARNIPDQQMEEFNQYIVDYFTKPFDNRELVCNVNRHYSRFE